MLSEQRLREVPIVVFSSQMSMEAFERRIREARAHGERTVELELDQVSSIIRTVLDLGTRAMELREEIRSISPRPEFNSSVALQAFPTSEGEGVE